MVACHQSSNLFPTSGNKKDWILELIFFLVLATSLSAGLIYLFLLCVFCSVLLLTLFSSLFDSWFVILISYLFFGGIMCVLAYFSSFSFSSIRFSNFKGLFFGSLICGGVVLTSKRLLHSSMNEFGSSWQDMTILSLLACSMLLVVMYSVISVNKEGWGGVRVFSL